MKRTIMYVLSALVLSSMVGIGLNGCGSSSNKATNQTVSSVTIFPQTATIWMGQTQAFTATAYDASGNPVPNVTFTWAVDSPTATSTASGNGIMATGNQAGAAQVKVIQVQYATSSQSSSDIFTGSPAVLTVNGNIGGGYELELAMGTINRQGQSATGLAWLATIRASNGTNLQTWNLTFTGTGIQGSLTATYKSDSHSQYSFDSGSFPNQPATSGTYYIKAVSADGSVTLMTMTPIDASQVLPVPTNIVGTSNNSVTANTAIVSWNTPSCSSGTCSYQAVILDSTGSTIITESDYLFYPAGTASPQLNGLTVGNTYIPLVGAFSIDLSALETDSSQMPSEVTGQFNVSIGFGSAFTE